MIQLKRVAYTTEGTFGVLLEDNIPFAVTAEEVWRGNARSISCIPTGRYYCTRYSSDRYPDTFLVNEVPNRDGILFHVGNTIKDTEGCILVGERFEQIDDREAVWQSQEGFDEFMDRLMDTQTFMLEVTD